jgi:hypothetical protein
MIDKITLVLCALALSNPAFSVEREVYRECESGSWIVPNFVVHVEFDVQRNSNGDYIDSFYGTYDGKYIRSERASANLDDYFNPVYQFFFVTPDHDSNSKTGGFPEGAQKFSINIEKSRSHYSSSDWIWDKNAGWTWSRWTSNDCFRIKGRP